MIVSQTWVLCFTSLSRSKITCRRTATLCLVQTSAILNLCFSIYLRNQDERRDLGLINLLF
jgi:hypothetical protein